MSIGVDIVHIPEFKKRLENPALLGDLFTQSELAEGRGTEGLAGVFAAKEACMKALKKKVGWREIWVEKTQTGAIRIFSTHFAPGSEAAVSISHSGDYAVAVVVLP